MGWYSGVVGALLYLKMFVDVYNGMKEISEDHRKTVVGAYQAEKDYKTIPKEFGLH